MESENMQRQKIGLTEVWVSVGWVGDSHLFTRVKLSRTWRRPIPSIQTCNTDMATPTQKPRSIPGVLWAGTI